LTAEAFGTVDGANLLAFALGPSANLVTLALDFAVVELDLRARRDERRQAHRDRAAEHLGKAGHHHDIARGERAGYAGGDRERSDQAVVEPQHQVAQAGAAGRVDLLSMVIVLASANREGHWSARCPVDICVVSCCAVAAQTGPRQPASRHPRDSRAVPALARDAAHGRGGGFRARRATARTAETYAAVHRAPAWSRRDSRRGSAAAPGDSGSVRYCGRDGPD